MHVETITYTDYDGNQRTEPFYFNLNKAEITEMQLGVAGGLSESLRKIITDKDVPRIMSTFKDLILKSYGIKSPDGKRFIKSAELSEEFMQTEAYSELYMKLVTDADEAASFLNKIIPADLAKAVEAEMAKNGDNVLQIPTT